MLVKIKSQTFPAELMITPEQISKGMMGRDSLNGCMVFKLKKGHHSFWMKNCLIFLDIIFVNDNKISKIHLNCPPNGNKLTPIKYNGFGNYVIEFPSGTANAWKIGDMVNIYQEKS